MRRALLLEKAEEVAGMNVIVICLDTLRWDALGIYNPDWVQTPEIDAFAARAARFDAAYCGSFPTVPMRVDAYTGQVNWPRYGWKGIDAEQPKLPLLMREAGYHTGLILDTGNNIGAGLHVYYDEYHWIKKEVADGMRPEDVIFPVPRENLRQNGVGYVRDMVETSHFRHERDWFVARTMQRASDWLEDHARRPFFLWVDTFEIHENWNPPAHYVQLYSKDYHGLDYSFPNYGYTDIYQPHELQRLRARYAGEVTLTDRWVGQLLRHIELLGLFENTLVILISDHGMYIGEHGRTGKHTVNPQDPWPIYDTVGRIPLLVWTPFAAPRTINALCQPADILPTILDTCGIECPPTIGKSWVPLLRGTSDEGHEAIYTTYHSAFGPGRIAYLKSLITVTTARYTAIFGPPPHEAELYDRQLDPDQCENISAAQPDVVEDLRTQLARFMRTQGAAEEYVQAYT
jgi:arylsulfatase A-like enzyme